MQENENAVGKTDDIECQAARPSVVVNSEAGAQVARAWLVAFRPSPQHDHTAGDFARGMAG